MKVLCWLCVAGCCLFAAPQAWADVSTPEATPAPPVATEPTAPPVVDTAPTAVASQVAPQVGPQVDSSPVAPARDHSFPSVSVGESGVPATPALTPITLNETGPTAPGVTLNPNVPGQARAPAAQAAGNGSSAAGPPAVSGALPPPDESAVSAPYISVSAPAPSQLTCTGKKHGPALPFLVSPYAGWTELVSFLDHDSPDYSVDGSIVIANGITATAGDGQESDLFPAYWAPSLRQFVNYDGHNGYDFGVSYQPILAAGNGTVSFAGWNSSDAYAGYGQMVLINHHNGYVTLYGHLSKLEVKQGDKVTAGQEIGISGTTGHSSGPHLHFSVFHNCQVTDPYGWTGTQADPLYAFDGEHSTYLWLPGHDPLVVNPPRDWPTFPLGLHLSESGLGLERTLASHAGRSRTPSIDRLLLLDLPRPHTVGTTSPAVALARTEASITQEAESLAPALSDLESQGLIERYQVIPAAAAVWLRGTAGAAQLLALPGVASLAGVQPHDLAAAQVELSHDVLIQIRHQEAPSLWPVGFRSALHPWRPMVTVVNRHALVTGLALPGQHVKLSVRRRGQIVGVAEASSDVNSGGFVAMLHDVLGSPVTVRPGDVVSVACGGKSDSIHVVPLEIRARSDGVSGAAAAGASVPVTLTRVGGSVSAEAVVTTDAAGGFLLPSKNFAHKDTLAAGELAVSTVADAGGDQEAASAFVPGAQLTEGSALVRGWTVGSSPRLQVIRAHRTLLTRRIHSAPDGTFQLELRRRNQLVPLLPGDVVRIGSRWHARSVTLPPLHVSLVSGTDKVDFGGPPNTSLALTVTRSDGSTVSSSLSTDDRGQGSYSLAGRSLSLGDLATLKLVTGSGDQVYANGQTRGILVHMASGTVSGTVHPGAVLSMHVVTGAGTSAGGAVATADRVTGSFSASLRTRAGQPVHLGSGMRLVVLDGSVTTTTILPDVTVEHVGSSVISTAKTRARQRLTWVGIGADGATITRELSTSARGALRDRYALSASPASLKRVALWLSSGDGVTVQRLLTLTKPHTSPSRAAAPRRAKARTTVKNTRAKAPRTARTPGQRSGRAGR